MAKNSENAFKSRPKKGQQSSNEQQRAATNLDPTRNKPPTITQTEPNHNQNPTNNDVTHMTSPKTLLSPRPITQIPL